MEGKSNLDVHIPDLPDAHDQLFALIHIAIKQTRNMKITKYYKLYCIISN